MSLQNSVPGSNHLQPSANTRGLYQRDMHVAWLEQQKESQPDNYADTILIVPGNRNTRKKAISNATFPYSNKAEKDKAEKEVLDRRGDRNPSSWPLIHERSRKVKKRKRKARKKGRVH